MTRRIFTQILAGISPILVLPFSESTITCNNTNKQEELSIGILADIHKDLVPDADQRLEKFIAEAIQREVDLIIQLGDFCFGESQNKNFLKTWNIFQGPKHHVLGNHDMDKNSKAEMLDFWGMQDTYYSFDFKGVHFVILDANFIYQDGKYTDYKNANFYINSANRTFIHPEQTEWLKGDLENTQLPTLVFSHQSLCNHHWGIRNRLSVQKVLEAHSEKVICCMNGHDHIDYHQKINGVNYVEINSASYFWMEDKYQAFNRFPKKLYEQYKLLPNLAMYEDPLFAFAKFSNQTFTLEGVRSKWVTPSPAEVGMPLAPEGSRCTPVISDYHIQK